MALFDRGNSSKTCLQIFYNCKPSFGLPSLRMRLIICNSNDSVDTTINIYTISVSVSKWHYVATNFANASFSDHWSSYYYPYRLWHWLPPFCSFSFSLSLSIYIYSFPQVFHYYHHFVALLLCCYSVPLVLISRIIIIIKAISFAPV